MAAVALVERLRPNFVEYLNLSRDDTRRLIRENRLQSTSSFWGGEALIEFVTALRPYCDVADGATTSCIWMRIAM
jgi:hypothetical protein